MCDVRDALRLPRSSTIATCRKEEVYGNDYSWGYKNGCTLLENKQTQQLLVYVRLIHSSANSTQPLPLSILVALPIMALFSNTSSLPIPPILSEQISLLDFVFPGFTRVLTTVLPLLTGDLSLYARLLCGCGVLVFFSRYAAEYLRGWLETHFS